MPATGASGTTPDTAAQRRRRDDGFRLYPRPAPPVADPPRGRPFVEVVMQVHTSIEREGFTRCDETGSPDADPGLKRLSLQDAAAADRVRLDLLRSLAPEAAFGCKETKLDCRDLSPGCRICGLGTWSCLFINGKCPCGCFYCPTEQNRIGVPTTQGIPFPKPEEYVRYLERFGFKGASISGGEPFLTFDTTLRFAAAVKKKFGGDLHLWLYTSGRLTTVDQLKRLQAAGLDEIRFNIGATRYELDNVRNAVGIIPVVTVEIPAIPEAFDLMKDKLREMRDAGVNHLNLHQLRLTPYNEAHLKSRGYTFLPGEKITVLESELTALRLIAHGIEQGIGLPVNYCSFVYKHRFQSAAFRRRNAAAVARPHEDITEGGYIRTLCLTGEPAALARQVEAYEGQGRNPALWSLAPGRDLLFINESLWDITRFDDFTTRVSYSEARVQPAVSYRRLFVEVPLTRHKTVFIERMRVLAERDIFTPDIRRMEGGTGKEAAAETTESRWRQIEPFEIILSGLQPYV